MDQLRALTEFFINVLGQSRADAEANAARNVTMDANRTWQNIDTPKLQQADLIEQGGSELGKYTEDPRTRNAQLKALEGLTREVDYQGMTPEDANAFAKARGEAGAMDAGFRGAADQQMAARGMQSGIGAYAAALGAGQAATNRGSEMGLQASADSRQRYLQALNSLGSMGGNVRGQDFGIASQRAQAQDAINRFNTGQRTQNQAYNLGLPQQDFSNQMDLAKGQSGSANDVTSMLYKRQQDAERTAAKWGASSSRLAGGMAGGMGGWGGGK